MSTYQHTLKHSVYVTGYGVHSNASVEMTIHPLAPGSGIIFRRTDLPSLPVPATWRFVKDTRSATIIGTKDGPTISTVEHILATFAALDIDNALVEVSGPEVPILDGSAEPLMHLLHQGGRIAQSAKRLYMKIIKPLTVEGDHGSWARLTPADNLEMRITVDERGRLPLQVFESVALKEAFMTDIAMARTFGFLEDAQKFWAQGLALGTSLDNTLVWDTRGKPLNPDGMRIDNECARHKALDALGDLMLLGHPLLGRYESHNGGHYLNNQLVRAIIAHPHHYEMITSHQLSVSRHNFPTLRRAP